MTIPRQVPHRVSRPERRAREVKQLKHEQLKLVRQNRRLKEELEKAKVARPRRTKSPRPSGAKVTGLPNAGRSELADAALKPLPAQAEGSITGLVCFSCGCQDCRRVDLGDHGEFICCPVCKAKRKSMPLKPPSGEI